MATLQQSLSFVHPNPPIVVWLGSQETFLPVLSSTNTCARNPFLLSCVFSCVFVEIGKEKSFSQ